MSSGRILTGLFSDEYRVLSGLRPDTQALAKDALKRDFLGQIADAILDTRTKVVTYLGVDKIRPDDQGFTLSASALILLLDPGQAEIGEFVAADRVNTDVYPPQNWCMKQPEWQAERWFEYVRFGGNGHEYVTWRRTF